MRTIFREQAYEQPLVAGRYQYRRGGQPTGSVESWRLTTAAGGHYFLRVDLNADAGEGGDSVLFHLLLNRAWGLERLNFRYFRPGGTVAGNLLFEEGQVTLSQTGNGVKRSTELVLPEPPVFWFPATTGLGLLAAHTPPGEYDAVTLVKEERFTLRPAMVTLRERAAETVAVMGQPWPARPVTVAWGEQRRTVWLGEDGWPLRMMRADGLLALETRRLRYQKHHKLALEE